MLQGPLATTEKSLSRPSLELRSSWAPRAEESSRNNLLHWFIHKLYLNNELNLHFRTKKKFTVGSEDSNDITFKVPKKVPPIKEAFGRKFLEIVTIHFQQVDLNVKMQDKQGNPIKGVDITCKVEATGAPCGKGVLIEHFGSFKMGSLKVSK